MQGGAQSVSARERYLETLLFGHPDRVPLAPGGPRESTLRAWHAQGLAMSTPYLDALDAALGIPRDAFGSVAHVPECLRMIPTFEEKVLECRDGHFIVQDFMGATTEISQEYDYTYIRTARDFVTRKWHRFPVQSRHDWEDKILWRYNPCDEQRFTIEFATRCREVAESDRAVAVAVNGPFWQMREWVGMENLCIMMAEQPDFVWEMAEFWRRFTLEALAILLGIVSIDVLMVSEDMAYKAHSMISPAMARRFLQPTYRGWHELMSAHGCRLFDMDSDGFIGELIPLWMEAGFNCCNPIEVAAGNDIVEYRRQFRRRMAYHGGIDKRAIAAGGQAMRDEVMRVAPLLAEGGYIPGCDHGVPPDISWPGFIEYTRLLAQLTGWL